MKGLFLTKYGPGGASSRIRTFQYLQFLEKNGVKATVSSLLDDEYLAAFYQGRSAGILKAARYFGRRVSEILSAGTYDVYWVEKELLPWLPFFMESMLLSRLKPLLIDYDDAIFHQYDLHPWVAVRFFLGKKIDRLMSMAEGVVAGNEYLAQRAWDAGAARVEVIPSAVDLRRYSPAENNVRDTFTIGWIGSPSTSRYLKDIEDALRELCRDKKTNVVVVGAPQGFSLAGVPTQFIPWAESTEVESLRRFDVGIMPVEDSPWARGKCGYKLIQYMACSLPVVASPVGVNVTLVNQEQNGYLATDYSGWVESLRRLRADADLRRAMGREGRKIVESRFCLQVTAPRLLSMLCSIAGK